MQIVCLHLYTDMVNTHAHTHNEYITQSCLLRDNDNEDDEDVIMIINFPFYRYSLTRSVLFIVYVIDDAFFIEC